MSNAAQTKPHRNVAGAPCERPILFSGAMVRAILAGRKTQTRRVVKPQPPGGVPWSHSGRGFIDRCPYGEPGDRLWVRETWGGDDLCGVAYRADHPDWPRFRGDGEQPDGPWRPSIYMPRWASRLTLGVTGVRVERLQDITEEDARAEGVVPSFVMDLAGFVGGAPIPPSTYLNGFRSLWDEINAKRAPWESDPWVWAVSFEVIRGGDVVRERTHNEEVSDGA